MVLPYMQSPSTTGNDHLDQERQRSAEQYLTLIQSSLDGFLSISTLGKVIDANYAACQIYGYSREEFLQLMIWDIDAEETAEESAAHIGEIINAGRIRFETKHRCKDGRIIIVEASVSYLPEFGDRFYGFFRDITERKRNEIIIQESEERLHLALLAGTQGWFEVNVQSGEVTVSPEYVRIIGYDPNTFHTSLAEWKEGLHPDDRDAVISAFGDCLATGESKTMEYRRKTGSGEWIWIGSVGKVTEWDKNGQPLKVIGSHTNINERKGAEAALRASETRLRTIIEESPIAIAFGRDGVTLEVNNAYLNVFGYEKASEVCGQSLLNQVAPQCRAEVTDRIKQRMLGELTASSYETVGLRKDGSEFPIYITGKRVMLNDGPITVGFIVDLSERQQADAEIYNLAYYDALTNLPNRRLFIDRLKASLLASARSRHFGAVLFIDIDNFKMLNDTLGHEYGDLLLIEVAKRIQSCVRDIDTVARMGGDDFVLLLEDVDENPKKASIEVGVIAEKIRSSLAEAYQIKGNKHHSSSSIGVVLYSGEDVSVNDLLKHSDMAMYRAKDSGRNAVRFFYPEMQLAVEAHVTLEADLHRAVPDKQLQLYYQTQVDCDNRLLGTEALVRWLHPIRGLVSPANFIPIAEESSLILEIGTWVLEAACQQLNKWSRDERTCHLTIAVNVSAKQFKQVDFVEQVARLIHTHEVNPACLKLELTESVVLNDVNDVITKMHALKALQVKLSLDDFGTGYSSLSYLKKLPLDQIKIDQSFVRDMTSDQNDVVMIQTIIDMAKNFQLNVIAEGVETEAQLKLLKQLGCLAYQGFLFSKPLPIDQIEALLINS